MKTFIITLCLFLYFNLSLNAQINWILTYKDSLPEFFITADRITWEGTNGIKAEGNVLFRNPIGIVPPVLLRPNPDCEETKQNVEGMGMNVQCGERAITQFGGPAFLIIFIYCTPSPMVCYITSENY
jgi:hypothetical protein